ncbi:4-hydroxy-tetrahydrodipicolinate reductase [Legionella massiliensis]|uniref:4-hydroxy-tetrahydrodipicolinate reductase n=1 Tax=Legionella massiliensis TaxID=1034943 RepID=A0A078KWG1_9GAMM|nr:4-hydroxy-tetrahydrodipicolinate reductase [Legionella massiliensis]CDZ76018.1 4-hydroxy-tetrahydrodipicolinate reductase [Legionella massiliensis]CEE11756.1 4-hydroxy-tetrahydrodipicolinate reductase [Legionella massiliensis]
MQIPVIVNGAHGKMGSLACETIKNHPDFLLVAGLTRQDNLRQAIAETKATIVIDLTRADCVYENSLTIIDSGAHPVIGTSGLLDDQIKTLKQYCDAQELGGIIVPNFSIGAVLMMRFAAQAARFLTEVEIIETHHQQKLDAPSGTAMKTAEMIAKARNSSPNQLALRELVSGARGGSHQGVPIHSLRLPGFIASQQVIFGSHGESLTISHNSIDRASFMPGLILACQGVQKLNTLYYGLETILDS